ncbi:unnamed protein product, partial [Prorocentrum cordatum]
MALVYVRLACEAHMQGTADIAAWMAVTAPFKAVLEARMSHSVEVAADGLLSQLCDAVVHLGEDLRMTQPSPHLAALLLRPFSCGGMRNVSFLDLFSCSEESERVRGFLLRDIPGADMLHSSMKDSNGVEVTVQLFHICGKDFDDQIFHVVGVREDAESFRMPPPSKDVPEDVPHATPACSDPLAEHSPSDGESVRTLQLESDTMDLAVYFRLFEAGHPVEKCSAGFTVLSGPSALGTRLMEWMVSADSFAERVQELCESALRKGRDLNTERSVQVRLRPPHLHRLHRELSAEAVLSLLHNDADAAVHLWTAKMELYDTKVVRKRGKSEKMHMQFRTLSKRPASVASIEEVSDELDLPEEIDVYFKVLEDGYPVTACCPRFASFVGLPESGFRLLDLFVKPEDFILRAQAVFSAGYHSGDFASSQMCRGVRLKQARKSTGQLSYGFKATVALSMDHNVGVEDANEWTVKARLSDVMKAPRHARSGGAQSAALEGHCTGDPQPV